MDTPTYDQLSALCAQLAAAVEATQRALTLGTDREAYVLRAKALDAYRTLSPDPQWQRVPEGCVVVPRHCTPDMVTAFKHQYGELLGGSVMQTMVAINAAISAGKRARGEG